MCLRILIKSEPVGQFLSFEAVITINSKIYRISKKYRK